jgi:hypothetical protein
MIVDAHEHFGAAERADDFGVGAGVAYDSQLTFLAPTLPRIAAGVAINSRSPNIPRHKLLTAYGCRIDYHLLGTPLNPCGSSLNFSGAPGGI